MADIIIKGMEMPVHCYRCPLRDKGDDHCVLQPESVETATWDFQMEHCPLIPLPEKHGRLIDADELKTAFPCGESVRTECVRATIDHALTIVPAEGGTDNG